MKKSIVQTLIWSDWYRHRAPILVTIVAGLAGIVVIQFRGELPTIVGSIFFYTSLIVFGCLLPTTNVINERKKQVLPFLMSLPLSVGQYTTAKLVSTFGIFLIPWLSLVATSVSLILGRRDIPDGFLPPILVLSTIILIGFCINAAAAIVSESEKWLMVAMIATNSTYGLSWYMLVRDAAIRKDMSSPVPVWSRQILTMLGAEVALIVAILALTFYLQSRKRYFI